MCPEGSTLILCTQCIHIYIVCVYMYIFGPIGNRKEILGKVECSVNEVANTCMLFAFYRPIIIQCLHAKCCHM